MENLADQILSMLQAKFGGSPTLEDHLTDIGIDSVGMAELTLELESNFKIRVDDGILDAQSINDLVEYVSRQQSNVAVD